VSRDAAGRAQHARLQGALLGGTLLATLFEVALLMLTAALRRVPAIAPAAEAFVRFVFDGGWFAFPLAGAGAAALLAARWRQGAARARALVLGVTLLLAPFVAHPAITQLQGESPPRGRRATITAILRWTFHTPHTVERILPYATSPDPEIREQATVAMGENLIVSDIEHATGGRPPRYADHPLRGRLRDALLARLAADSSEGVRAEAARALWKAPRTFGVHRAAAETLAAVLDRGIRAGVPEALVWSALDAAAGAPDSALKAAAARFAATTGDTELARVARIASRWPASP